MVSLPIFNTLKFEEIPQYKQIQRTNDYQELIVCINLFDHRMMLDTAEIMLHGNSWEFIKLKIYSLEFWIGQENCYQPRKLLKTND